MRYGSAPGGYVQAREARKGAARRGTAQRCAERRVSGICTNRRNSAKSEWIAVGGVELSHAKSLRIVAYRSVALRSATCCCLSLGVAAYRRVLPCIATCRLFRIVRYRYVFLCAALHGTVCEHRCIIAGQAHGNTRRHVGCMTPGVALYVRSVYHCVAESSALLKIRYTSPRVAGHVATCSFLSLRVAVCLLREILFRHV